MTLRFDPIKNIFVEEKEAETGRILSGNGKPSPISGRDGDVYLDKKELKFYSAKKENWPDPIELRGKDGRDGRDGVGADGERGEPGIPGDKGDKGDKGADGAGIASIEQQSETEIKVTLTDGSAQVFLLPAPIPGRDGLSGKDGREIELSRNQTHVVWRYRGDGGWADLFPIPKAGKKGGGGGIHHIRDAADSAINNQTLAATQVLQYDGNNWVNVPTSSIVSGYVPHTGATADVDLGAYSLASKALAINSPADHTLASVTIGTAGQSAGMGFFGTRTTISGTGQINTLILQETFAQVGSLDTQLSFGNAPFFELDAGATCGVSFAQVNFPQFTPKAGGIYDLAGSLWVSNNVGTAAGTGAINTLYGILIDGGSASIATSVGTHIGLRVQTPLAGTTKIAAWLDDLSVGTSRQFTISTSGALVTSASVTGNGLITTNEYITTSSAANASVVVGSFDSGLAASANSVYFGRGIGGSTTISGTNNLVLGNGALANAVGFSNWFVQGNNAGGSLFNDSDGGVLLGNGANTFGDVGLLVGIGNDVVVGSEAVSIGAGSKAPLRSVSIGYAAGAAQTSSNTGCVLIGPYAGYTETADNKLYISNYIRNLITGDFSAGWVYLNGNVYCNVLPNKIVATDSDSKLVDVAYQAFGNSPIGNTNALVYRDSRGAFAANNYMGNLTSTATAAGTTTLTDSSARTQVFTGTSTQNCVLPDARTLEIGWQYQIVNRSTGAVTVKDGASSTLLTLPASSAVTVTCLSTSTLAGSWDYNSTSFGGTVTSFSSGNLSPLFTTSVATATTTPALSFSLSNAAAGTWFGNNTAGSTTPSYNNAGALTKVNDTNVTLTLGGTPTTALLNATSLTLGWTGQLGLTRGGTNASLTASNGGIVYSTASALAILSASGQASHPMLSGGAGAPTWSAAYLVVGSGANDSVCLTNNITTMTSSLRNVFVGAGAGNNSLSGARNVAVGAGALAALTSGNYNVIVGDLAGGGITTGSNNIGIGPNVISTNASNAVIIGASANGGTDSTAVGRGAGQNTTGVNNSCFGSGAGLANTTGTDNVFIGMNAGYGTSSGASSYNVCIGSVSMRNLQSGANGNTCLGYGAGYGITTGDYNVMIGYNAGKSFVSTTSNNLYIANSDTAAPLIKGTFPNTEILFYTASAAFVGASTATTTKLGIGIASPVYTLDIRGAYSTSNYPQIRLDASTVDGAFISRTLDALKIACNIDNSGTIPNSGRATAGVQIVAMGSDSYITFGTTPTNNTAYSECMRIDKSGKLGIGTSAPDNTLHVHAYTAGIRISNTSASGDYRWDILNYSSAYDATYGNKLVFTTPGYSSCMLITTSGGTPRVGIDVASPAATLDVGGSTTMSGNLSLNTAGGGVFVKEGTNATMGVATLASGSVTVSTTKVTANSRIFLTANSNSGTEYGIVKVSARSAGTSFTITSYRGNNTTTTATGDTSTVAWIIVEPA